ncbi:MAG: DUF4139 domain-containing protein, partial [Flavobacteriales bacterium]|nr:DUF4139 domain-containing protein [Flavobacteriales bacterium]
MRLITVPKSIYCLLISFSISASIYAQVPSERVKVISSIEEAKVFLEGVSITRTAKLTLHAGDNRLLLPGLASNIDPSTIQVGGVGDFTILSVGLTNNYMNQTWESNRVKDIKDSLRSLKLQLGINIGLKDVLEDEKDMILTNKSIGSEQLGVDIEALEDASDFFRDRLLNIKREELLANNKIEVLSEQVKRIELTLENAQKEDLRGSGEIFLNIRSKTVQAGMKITFSYYTTDAYWVPTYDIRAKTNETVILDFKGNVTQNTGVNWKDVKIVLSTANPSLNGDKPELYPWRLKFTKPRMQAMAKAGSAISSSSTKLKRDVSTSANHTSKSIELTNVTYRIHLPYSIASNNTRHSIDIQSNNVRSSYKNYCVPKINEDVYLMAQITRWEQYNLLSGDANIFLDGTYVGKTFINTTATNDTLDISLGRDKQVVVRRKKLTEFSKNKVVGPNKELTNTYEILVKNNKSGKLNLELYDQIPLSTSGEISVIALEISKGLHTPKTGEVLWNLKLGSGEQKKLKIS